MSDYIQINRKDNVAVAMRDLSKGELIAECSQHGAPTKQALWGEEPQRSE